MDNGYLKKRIHQLEKRVSDLQSDNEGLKQVVLVVSTNVEGLCRKVIRLEEALATKTDITHVQRLVKQSGEDSQNG